MFCSEMTKAGNLLDAGAASVLFYNDQPYPSFKQSMNIDDMPHAKQMFCTDLATGKALTAALEAGRNIKMTRIVSKKYLNPNAEKISWFSSWGPVRDLVVTRTVIRQLHHNPSNSASCS